MRVIYTSPGRKIVVYPNAIELWVDEQRIAAYTPEEWAQMVEFVGIRGFRPEPDDIEQIGAALHQRELQRRRQASAPLGEPPRGPRNDDRDAGDAESHGKRG